MGHHEIPYTLEAHADTHEAGGDDEVDVGGLSGVLADPQTPIGHHTLHELGNADAIVNPLNAGALPALSNTKIWQGNVGNRPVEVALPAGGAVLIVAETEVFNGSKGSVWEDLDLSGTVGAQATLVLLKVAETGNEGAATVAVRKNGDTDEFRNLSQQSVACSVAMQNSAALAVLLVATSDAGVIEWRLNTTLTVTVDVIAYIK